MTMREHVEKNREQVRAMIEDEKLTQRAIAARLGVGRSVIERACKLWGLQTQRTGPRALAGHPNWKGGRMMHGRYWYVRADDHPHCTKNGYVAEHRLVVEADIGRYLRPREVVHHIDGDPGNNLLANLMVFQTNADHLRFDLAGKRNVMSAEGSARISAAVRQRFANQRALKADGGQHTPPNSHQPSLDDSTHEPQACETEPTQTP